MSLIDQIGQNPLIALKNWLSEADVLKLAEPTAMTLATVDASGSPQARIVLCKGVTEEGVTFYTNYESDKAKELNATPFASLVFFWQPLGRQVRIRGQVQKVDRATSEAYFATRPRESQIGAWASKQSQPVASFSDLMAEVARVEAHYAGKPIPCPPHWGGYLVRPTSAEFWLAAPGRLHDRVAFTKVGDIWQLEQRYP